MGPGDALGVDQAGGDQVFGELFEERLGELVQVQIGGQTPAVRSGEVLVADAERIAGWRNIGETEATLFWIVIGDTPTRSRGIA